MRSEFADRSAPRDPLSLALGVTLGAGLLLALPRLPGLPWLALVAVPALLPWRGRAWYALLALGFLAAGWRAGAVLRQQWPPTHDGAVIDVRGTIADLPRSVGSAQRPLAWRFQFVPAPGQALPPRRMRVSWYRSESIPHGGQCWHLALKIKAPHGAADPGAFDYERWLFAQGFGATATVLRGRACGDAPGFGWLRTRARLRAMLERDLAGVPGRALVETMVLGDRSGLRPDDWRVFRATGTSHLVAVAGLHLAVVAAAALFVLRWLWVIRPSLAQRLPAQKAALVGAVLVGIAYAALTGFALPAVRACLMMSAAAAAMLLGGTRNFPRALALAWMVIVVLDPLALLGASLWLSFAAVALIAWIVGGRLGRQSSWRRTLELQVGLSVGLIPLTLWFFGTAGWTAPLANLFVVPAAMVLLPATLVTALLALAWPGPGVALLKATALGWHAVREVLGFIAAHAPAQLVVGAGHPIVLLLALLGVVLWLAPRALPVRVLGAVCLLPLLMPGTRAPAAGTVELTALDVGEGLSLVVRTRRHALLFDAGPKYPGGLDMGEAVVVPYLRRVGVRRIDLLLISHRDMDHRGGAAAVRAAMPVSALLGALGATPCRDGQHWIWDGVGFEVLNPSPRERSRNDRSCVLRISLRRAAVLLPADIEASAERGLLARHAGELPAEVLVAPHHGSAGSSTPVFVAAVMPRLVVYPAGWENRFRFPRPAVTARYRRIGARQLQTGVEGAVRVRIDDAGIIRIDRYRCRHPRLWRVRPPDC